VPGPLLIADVPWLLYRSFFGLPKSIVGSDGRPVNALLGTVNALLSIYEGRLTAPGARGVVACTGAEQADYRVRLYPAYHAHREPMPAELAWQWRQAPALLESLGWTVADGGELEADDVMFSYARVEQQAGGEALLITGDRDLYGAVGERVSVVELRKGGEQGLLGVAEVRERYGVDPELVPDLIALRGDPSDGIPGAPGIGAKTAAELLRAHGSLEAVLAAAGAAAPPGAPSGGAGAEPPTDAPPARGAARADSEPTPGATPPMRPRVAAALREHAELLRTFKHIATLQRIDVERPPDRSTDFAGGALKAGELDMKRLAERLEGMIGAV
jgi:5'-3' exonuclease